MYDCYAAGIAMAGGVARPVPLHPPAEGTGRWTFDPDELRAAITPRTTMLLLNTPHNPTGKVFTRDELGTLAGLAIDHDLLVLTDEVYEHLVFGGATHTSIATLPGMRERTLVVSSAGKTFNVTGWKIGWICGPAPLVAAVRTAKQFLTYVNGGPFQPAVAAGLRLPDEYFTAAARDLEYRRDVLVQGLRDAGLPVIAPEATYFATVDVRGVQPDGDGLAFCRALPERAGVVAVPSGVFYAAEHAAPGPAPGAVRLLQERRRARGGGRAVAAAGMRIAAVQHDTCASTATPNTPVAGRTIDVLRVDPSAPAWSEAGTHWNNQPATTGSAVASASLASAGWQQWTVTSLVTSAPSGTYSGFLLRDHTESSGTAYWQLYSAREHTTTTSRPQLVLTWG